MRGPVAGALLAPLVLAAQTELPRETLLLARIKVKMSENLTRLPNYTCLETIERSRRRVPSRKYELMDALRLEVALVNGKEMFSWPGAAKFEERDLRYFAPGGAIGNGAFALHARSVFLTDAATFVHVGEEMLGTRRTVRYDYRVPQFRSGYRLRVGEAKGTAGYHGSFWADTETLDLIRLQVIADEIPPNLPLREASDALEYARMPIGESTFLLPRSSELIMLDLRGNESRNRTTFSGCKQYTGESVLSFADPDAIPDPAPVPVAAAAPFQPPAGLQLETKLSGPIRSGAAAVGDEIAVVVERPVKKNGIIVVPKGAIVKGRLTRLERRGKPFDHYVVGLSFSSLEFTGANAAVSADLVEIGSLLDRRNSGGNRLNTRSTVVSYRLIQDPASRRPTQFYFVGTRLEIPPGTRIVLRLEPQASQENPAQ